MTLFTGIHPSRVHMAQGLEAERRVRAEGWQSGHHMGGKGAPAPPPPPARPKRLGWKNSE